MISAQVIEERKRSIERRLRRDRFFKGPEHPALSATNIRYEIAERTKGINYGGIGLMHMLARQSGLVDAIDRRLHLLKLYLPYRESDHVLNIAYNALCEGRTLEDIELRRNDETFLDALDAERIPDPATAGDFCRRFKAADIGRLQDAIDEARLKVWARQKDDFFEQATIDMDGSLVDTTGQCGAWTWPTTAPGVITRCCSPWQKQATCCSSRTVAATGPVRKAPHRYATGPSVFVVELLVHSATQNSDWRSACHRLANACRDSFVVRCVFAGVSEFLGKTACVKSCPNFRPPSQLRSPDRGLPDVHVLANAATADTAHVRFSGPQPRLSSSSRNFVKNLFFGVLVVVSAFGIYTLRDRYMKLERRIFAKGFRTCVPV